MKLEEVTIKNYRCFSDLTVKLHPEVNVIVGTNGAGKTALLDAIALGLQSEFEIRVDWDNIVQDNHILNNFVPMYHSHYHKLDILERDIFKNENNSSGLNILTKLNLEDSTSKFNLTVHTKYFLPDNEFAISYNFTPISDLLYNDRYIKIAKNNLYCYFHTKRVTEKDFNFHSLSLEQFVKSPPFEGALVAGQNYRPMMLWLYLTQNEDNLLKINKQDFSVSLKAYDAVQNALKTAIENIEKLSFAENPPVLFAELKVPEGESKLKRFDQLSDGYATLITIILDYAWRLAQIHPELDNPLEGKGILLIDEIELHLHPIWQQRVIPDLRRVFPNTQLIVATHSPAVVSSVRSENLIVLNSDHQIEPVSSEFRSYGAEYNRVLAEIFGAESRSQYHEIYKNRNRYRELIELRQENLPEALELRKWLDSTLEQDDDLLKRADLRIKILQHERDKNAKNR